MREEVNEVEGCLTAVDAVARVATDLVASLVVAYTHLHDVVLGSVGVDQQSGDAIGECLNVGLVAASGNFLPTNSLYYF